MGEHSSNLAEERGRCIFCNDRVKSDHSYVTTRDGYVHKNCLMNEEIPA
ncbi:MAG: hypothetical protein ABEJ83_05740 [Candidatus Nanohaloarchaea archaeon]